MNVIVFGSIGYGGYDNIEQLYETLKELNYPIINHIMADGMDYRHIKDFRFEKLLSEKITKHDVEYILYSDVAILLTNKPSYGAAIELYEAKKQGKITIVFAENEVPTPWIISYTDFIVTSKKELIERLKWCEVEIKRKCNECKSKHNVLYIPKLKKYKCLDCCIDKIKENWSTIGHKLQGIETQLDSSSQKLLRIKHPEAKKVVYGLKTTRFLQEFFPIQERSLKRSWDSIDENGDYKPDPSKQNWKKFKRELDIKNGVQKHLGEKNECL